MTPPRFVHWAHMSNKFSHFCPRPFLVEKLAAGFFKIARARARGVRGLRAPKMKAATRRLRHFAYLAYFVYLGHLSACSAFGAQRAPVHAQAARRPFRPWSATCSVVAAPQELVLLLGSIARQCGPIVSGCTAPTRKMSPVNGGIGAGQQPSSLYPPPLTLKAH